MGPLHAYSTQAQDKWRHLGLILPKGERCEDFRQRWDFYLHRSTHLGLAHRLIHSEVSLQEVEVRVSDT